MKKVIVLMFFSFAMMLVSCQKQSLVGPNPPTESKTMDNLQVPSSFNWKTTRTVQLTLTAKANNLVDITSSKGVSFQRAFLKANTAYTMKLVIPAYEKTLKVKFMGQEVTLNINSDNLSYQFK
ncbi:MAG: hypothetical protein JXR71_04215 [Bacteroidales bacterium]|nr:hypothetical protein [Bacteroidales bacterium]